jgi:hypothetical protein
MDVVSLFNTIFTLSGAVILLSEYVSRYTKADGKWARLQSWTVAILLGIFGTWLNIGIFHDMDWKGGLLIGIITGLVSNGIFSIDAIKSILETLKVRV